MPKEKRTKKEKCDEVLEKLAAIEQKIAGADAKFTWEKPSWYTDVETVTKIHAALDKVQGTSIKQNAFDRLWGMTRRLWGTELLNVLDALPDEAIHELAESDAVAERVIQASQRAWTCRGNKRTSNNAATLLSRHESIVAQRERDKAKEAR